MEIYEHKRTGVLYRKIIDSFSVERQRHSVVYVSLKTGDVFDRDREMFANNFRYVRQSQVDIKPKEPHS